VVLGLGMAVTVAPLTTAVLNAVPTHRTGVASGINNAVASVGSLLVIAVVGSLAVGAMSGSLERRLAAVAAPPEVRRAVEAARGGFVIPPLPEGLPDADRQLARTIVAASIEDTVRMAQWVAAALALAGVLTVAGTLPRRAPPRS